MEPTEEDVKRALQLMLRSAQDEHERLKAACTAAADGARRLARALEALDPKPVEAPKPKSKEVARPSDDALGQVLSILKRAPGPMTASEIADVTKRSRTHITNCLNALRAEEKVRKLGGMPAKYTLMPVNEEGNNGTTD